jgi:hypothetical protein
VANPDLSGVFEAATRLVTPAVVEIFATSYVRAVALRGVGPRRHGAGVGLRRESSTPTVTS